MVDGAQTTAELHIFGRCVALSFEKNENAMESKLLKGKTNQNETTTSIRLLVMQPK